MYLDIPSGNKNIKSTVNHLQHLGTTIEDKSIGFFIQILT